jgi:uncharacterized protein YecT (DUF1311 family)
VASGRIERLLGLALLAMSLAACDGREPAQVCASAYPEECACSRRASHAGQRECLTRLAAKTDAELIEIESLLQARIRSRESADHAMAEYRRRSLAHHEAGIVAYRKYRDAHCELWASVAAGGNGADDMRLSCRVALDRDRAANIHELMQGLDP